MVRGEQRGRFLRSTQSLSKRRVATSQRKNRQMANSKQSKAPKEILVVGSKVKDVIRDAGLRSDGELIQAVSDKVHELLADAIERTKSNNRSTVRPHDL